MCSKPFFLLSPSVLHSTPWRPQTPGILHQETLTDELEVIRRTIEWESNSSPLNSHVTLSVCYIFLGFSVFIWEPPKTSMNSQISATLELPKKEVLVSCVPLT